MTTAFLYLFLGIGVIFSIIGIVVTCKRVLFLFRAERTVGEITEVEARMKTKKGRTLTYYYPKASFTARDQSGHEIVSNIGYGKCIHEVGQSIDVRYDPSNPQKAILGGTLALWGLPFALLFLGAVSLLVSIRNLFQS